MRMINAIASLFVLASAAVLAPAITHAQYIETPMFKDQVAAGELPPVAERLPALPSVVRLPDYQQPGHHGGQMRLLFGRAKDIRLLVVYGYSRLVGFNVDYELVPDILRDI